MPRQTAAPAGRRGAATRKSGSTTSAAAGVVSDDLELRLRSATVRLPREVPRAGLTLEAAVVDRRRRAAHAPSLTARPASKSGPATVAGGCASSVRLQRALDDLERPRIAERTAFKRVVGLPQLGLGLAVDEQRADYAPDRRSRDDVTNQRDRRVELSQFLFQQSSRRPATSSRSRRNSGAEGSRADGESAVQASSTPRSVADAAAVTLEALQQLPPGVLGATPYLEHVRRRCEFEHATAVAMAEEEEREAEPAPSSARRPAMSVEEEAALFDAFSRHLADNVAAGEAVGTPDEAQAAFREFARSWISAPANKAGHPSLSTAVPGSRADADAAAPQPFVAGPTAGKNTASGPRPPTAKRATPASRPASAKFMLSVSEKKAFLTDLVERRAALSAEEQESEPSASPPTELPPQPAARQQSASARSAKKDRPSTAGSACHELIAGPDAVPHTQTAASCVAKLRDDAAQRHPQPDPRQSVAVLDSHDQYHERQAMLGHLRFGMRSARLTQQLAQRGICRPNSAPKLPSSPGALSRAVPAAQAKSEKAEV